MSVSSMGEARSRSAITGGVVAGVLAAMMMAAYAMIAAITYQDTGFFTPLYHIASSVLAPDAMMASVGEAQSGALFHLEAGPAVVGLALHMMVGAFFGSIFGLLAVSLRLAGPIAIAVGIVYGLAVLLVMSFVGLPVVAALFGGGDPIRTMPTMVGWTTFALEHAIFGFVLGLWPALRPQDVAAPEVLAAQPA